MTKKLIVLFLMLLLPVTIWAQNSVTFDFSSSSQEVQSTMEKDGITLKITDRSGKPFTPSLIYSKGSNFLQLIFGGLLTIKGDNCIITSVIFVVSDKKYLIKVYNIESGQLPYAKFRDGSKYFYKQEWNGESDKVIFTSSASQAAYIKSIEVKYDKGVSIAVSSAERATLYYGNKSFIIPKGVVARTYKIKGNVLSQSKEYKEGAVLPKGTAVVLEAKEGKYFFEETSKKGEADPNNALRGSDINTITSGGEVYYVFGKGSNGVGFYWKEPNGKAFNTDAHKAYLVYTPSKTTNAKSFLGFDVALEIQGPMVSEKTVFAGPIYNLAGQQVDKDYKGIIIVNGKKFLNR